jgi:hypothetical protein
MKMKKMNTSKSKKGKKRSYRKDNNRARGITSSKPKNKNPFEKLYDLENQQNIMTILEKMVAIKEIDPENTVVTISGETIRKKPKDMSPKELKSVLHLLNVDTKNALEKSELVTLLENEFKKTSNSKIDKTFVDTIQKKRQLLLKHLKEEEERQRVENLKKQKIAEEQRRRDEEHRRLKEEEKRKKREEEERQQRDEFDEQVREAKEWDRYNTQRELEQQQMENPYYRTSYRSQYPYPSSSHSYVPPYPPSSYYYEQQEAQRQLNEIPIELRYGHKYSDKSSKNFFGGK